MKYFSFTVIFGLLMVTKTLLAQDKFEPGYVINAQNDTIKGFIAYADWSSNPVDISFKTKPDAEAKTYLPRDISSFYVHDKNYIKAAVLADETVGKIKVSSEFPFHPVLEDTVLLLELVPGVKSLYYLKDKKGKEHFYINRSGEMEWLIFEFLKNKQEGSFFNNAYVTNATFKNQLWDYFDKCASINRRINVLSYSKKSLTNVFWKYYQKCRGRR